MTQCLDGVQEAVISAATEMGLAVCPAKLDLEDYPKAKWERDWLPFVQLAQQVHAALVYVDERRYDREATISTAMAERRLDVEERQVDDSAVAEAERGSAEWAHARIAQRIAPWDGHEGEVILVELAWLKDGIAHVCRLGPPAWFAECLDAIKAVLDETEVVGRDERVLRSRESSRRLHECATQMANHPRFAEATNEDKRLYMAQQLFPDVDADPSLGFNTRSVASLASLVYWWGVAPGEQVTRAERARELYRAGESIANIAAVLKLSEAKVRAAIAESRSRNT